VKGALSMAIAAAKQRALRASSCPSESAAEAAVVEEIEAIPVASLAQAVGFFADFSIEPGAVTNWRVISGAAKYRRDFADCSRTGDGEAGDCHRGAGNHNILMLGPPAVARRCSPRGCDDLPRR